MTQDPEDQLFPPVPVQKIIGGWNSHRFILFVSSKRGGVGRDVGGGGEDAETLVLESSRYTQSSRRVWKLRSATGGPGKKQYHWIRRFQ